MNKSQMAKYLKQTKAMKLVLRCYNDIKNEIEVIKERDPAATNNAQILFMYSGLHAVMAYRLAHMLHKKGYRNAARFISQSARFLTGIEIHPGAQIGKGLFIDHGSGVVIGETAIVGDNCTIYQGVTLGGTGKHTGKRHPTLGSNVMVGAGAKVLGPFTVGDNSKIAANAVVLEPIPENSTAVGIPARIVRRNGEKVEEGRRGEPAKIVHTQKLCENDLDQIHIPDPVAQEICRLQVKIDKLEKMLKELEK